MSVPSATSSAVPSGISSSGESASVTGIVLPSTVVLNEIVSPLSPDTTEMSVAPVADSLPASMFWNAAISASMFAFVLFETCIFKLLSVFLIT